MAQKRVKPAAEWRPPKRKVALAARKKVDRKKERADMGPLRTQLVSSQTLSLYNAALVWFFTWLKLTEADLPTDTFDFDDLTAEAIECA